MGLWAAAGRSERCSISSRTRIPRGRLQILWSRGLLPVAFPALSRAFLLVKSALEVTSDTWSRRRRRSQLRRSPLSKAAATPIARLRCRVVCFQVTGTSPALFAVRQTCKAPSGVALLSQYWWAIVGHGSMVPRVPLREQSHSPWLLQGAISTATIQTSGKHG
jgi:hypothetical protein